MSLRLVGAWQGVSMVVVDPEPASTCLFGATAINAYYWAVPMATAISVTGSQTDRIATSNDGSDGFVLGDLPAAFTRSANAGIKPYVLVNNNQQLSVLGADPSAYVAYVVSVINAINAWKAANPTLTAFAPDQLTIMNETYGNWFHGSSDSTQQRAVGYGQCATAAMNAAKTLDPSYKISLVLGDSGYAAWNTYLLAQLGGSFAGFDRFDYHLYKSTAAQMIQDLDAVHAWVIAQPGGAGLECCISEHNVWNGTEAQYIQYMTDVVPLIRARSWIKLATIFTIHGYGAAGSPSDTQGFYSTSGTLRAARAAAYKAAIAA